MKTSFSAIVATNRAEIVDQLRSLADALEGDEPVEMDLNGMELEFDLPEDSECGFELELDSDGECEFELEISWNARLTAATAGPSVVEDTANALDRPGESTGQESAAGA